jgi:hypothetical protein
MSRDLEPTKLNSTATTTPLIEFMVAVIEGNLNYIETLSEV